jgi:ATP-binding cassette, subfamily B, multidrug efflux pump
MRMSHVSSKSKWWHYLWLRSQTVLIFFILLNLAVTMVTGYLTPRFIKQFYDSLGNSETYPFYFKLLAGLFVVEYVNRFLYQVSSHRYIQVLLNEVRIRSFSLWLNAPFKKKERTEEYPLGEILARLMSDTEAIKEIVSSGGFSIFIDIIFIISCLVSFLQLNSTTGVLLFLAEVGACLLLVWGSKAMAHQFMELRRVTGFMARVVTDITSGLKELFFSPNKQYASRRGEKIFEEFLKKQLKANVWDASYYSAAESLYPILVALVMIIVPYSQIVEVAILAAPIDLIQRSITPIKDVAGKISVLTRAQTGIVRIHQFNESFEHHPVTRLDYSKLEVSGLDFRLDRFQYEQGFALENIPFNLQRGQVLGILGESGCGKSTLLKLLSGQYHVFEGSIDIDGRAINPEDEKELRNFSSYVSLISQESHVFTETLRFNVTMGANDGFDHFWELAQNSIPYLKRWGLAPDDRVFPKALSMGQKQLISGLRALFLKKPIILMDEISSGLDSELESALRDLIRFFQQRSITIIVTHRLETILNADRLILLEKGHLIVSGTPEELRRNASYQEFLKHLNS